MKNFVLLIAAMLLSIQAYAFEFDGINLNDDVIKVTRAISSKKYVQDPERNCLKGVCFGTEIYLSLNIEDVNTKGKVGQLIVDVPMSDKEAFKTCSELLNVIYHQIDKKSDCVVYSVDADGTTLNLKSVPEGVKLIYNTPYYKPAK
ncbi:MAG: hypothetical protein IJS20_02470 [Bacteroidales bacterium]|nr:hypothetical protein [Bacteroidales bacterium]